MKDLGQFDLVIIGGGINGAGIARDAAGRGLSVLMCEKGDLGEGTSSRSGKLIHGGLRYLEYYEFRLVREALIEREVLLRAAPHIVWPMRFVLPHSPEQRPAWLVRLGLFLYDHLGGRQKLPGCRSLDLSRCPEGAVIKEEYRKAFEYSDCWVDDARLVVLNALDAKSRSARIMVRTAATSMRRHGDRWTVELRSTDGRTQCVHAHAVVNAAGPWVQDVIANAAALNSSRKVRLVKGSHIIVRKFWDGPHAFLFQNEDKRVIFVNPYEGDLCLIGTTDIPYEGNPEDVKISSEEVVYLLAAVNRFLKIPLTHKDIVASYSGVRPLHDDSSSNPSAVTRDYAFEVQGSPPLLSIFGGKITTYRKLAEHALQKLKPSFPHMGPDWTAATPLPGGDMPNADFDQFLVKLRNKFPRFPPELLLHYARLYGTRLGEVLGTASSIDDLGMKFGSTFYEVEARHLVNNEWALSAEDILFRRTKHGLHLSGAERAGFEAWMRGAARPEQFLTE